VSSPFVADDPVHTFERIWADVAGVRQRWRARGVGGREGRLGGCRPRPRLHSRAGCRSLSWDSCVEWGTFISGVVGADDSRQRPPDRGRRSGDQL